MNGKERFIQFLQVLPKLLGNLLMLVFVSISLWMIWQCSRTANPSIIIVNILLAAGSATAAALLMVNLYLPGVAERITFSILYPRRYLKKAPVSLSPIQGMIAAGDFEQAEEQLIDLLHQFPDHTAAALMLVRLYADTLEQPGQAAAAAERYLDFKPGRPDPQLHFQLLMRYADLLQGTEREPELKKRLEIELKRRRLPHAQTVSLQARLSAMQNH